MSHIVSCTVYYTAMRSKTVQTIYMNTLYASCESTAEINTLFD